MQPTHNILLEKIRAQSIESLGRHLAAAIDLQCHLRQARWNVRGPGGTALRELLDGQFLLVESHLSATRLFGLVEQRRGFATQDAAA